MDASPETPAGGTPLLATAQGHYSTAWKRCRQLSLLAACCAVSAIALAATDADTAVSSAMRQLEIPGGLRIPGDLAKAIDLSEVFGHGMGVAAILVSVMLLVTPAKRPAVWVAVIITLASGLASNGMKSLFVRVRPHSVGLIRVVDGLATTGSNPQLGSPLSAEQELVPVSIWDSRQRSFPSGHAATAWGLAIGLSFVFPRGVGLFACFATLASLQRITSGAHFPTDVLAGATIAFVLSACLLSLPSLRKLRLFS